ncbi:MAG TPA: CoA-binding protein [Thermodesulfobacteriota bacterium]|nr:CoA-binding protein [Thermodesulfobacteriota bacterium]
MTPEKTSLFDRLFHPRSVAIVGISRTYTGLGGQFFLKNLRRAEFPGRIYLVHPSAEEISGIRTHPSVTAIPDEVDLVIVCVPAASVPALLEECSRKGIRNVHILSSGFKELGTAEGIRLENEIRRISEKGGLNIIGPNCMGPYVPASRLMLWGQIPAGSGSFAFLSQSWTLTQRMSEHGHFTGMGISKAVSFGNAAVLDSTDYLEYLAGDDETKVIGLYLESVRDGNRFLNVARALNRRKPLVLWKGGETSSGAGAVASHTGTLSGEDRIWENGLRQAGVTRVRSLEEVAGTAMALLRLPAPQGRRVFILGGGGGNSVYYADICLRLGLQVPPIAGRTRDRISALVPEVGSFARNPVDAWKAFFDPGFMRQILDAAFDDPDLDMFVLDRLIARSTYATPETRDATPETIDYLRACCRKKPLVAVVDGGGEDAYLAGEAARLRQLYCRAGIPAYASLPLAARALSNLASYFERNTP